MIAVWFHAIATEYPGGIPPHWNITGAEVVRLFVTRAASASSLPLIAGLLGYFLIPRLRTRPLIFALCYAAAAAFYISMLMPMLSPDPGAPASLGLFWGGVGGCLLGATMVSFGLIRWFRRLRPTGGRGFPVESS